MRVAVVSPYDLGRPGGVQDQCRRLVGWLADTGNEAALVGPGESGPEGAVLLGRATPIPANRSIAPIMLDPRIGPELRRALSGFDVVHVHEPLMPVVSLIALRTGAATVATFHADPPAWAQALYRYGRPAVRLAMRGADSFTAVSPVAAIPIEGLVEYRLIPNGIDVSDYATGPKEPGRVTFLGRDDPRKGLSVLLEAWPRVRGAIPEATLHVIGAHRAPAVPGVTFLGPVSEEEKRAELAASVVHAAPNLGGESFGIVVLEAMASGCAVVASALPGFEYVAGDTAAFVTPGDGGELADAIVGLLERPRDAGGMGEAARRRSHEFDGKTVAARYLETYADALAR